MKFSLRFLKFTFFLCIVSAHAGEIRMTQKECGDVDIRDRMEPDMAQFFSEPRDQDSIGWCYGFTAADLMTAEYRTPVSAINTSALYNRDERGNFFMRIGRGIEDLFTDSLLETHEGGYTKKAIKAAMDSPKLCSEDDLPFDTNYPQQTIKEIYTLEQLQKVLREEYNKETNRLSSDGCFYLDIQMNQLALLSGADQGTIASELINNNINEVLANILDKSCNSKNGIIPVKKKVRKKSRPILHRTGNNDNFHKKRDHERRTRKWFSNMVDTLKKGKPLGIDYNVKHVTGDSGMHASVVMATRWKDGKCQVKIRNSWGASCAYYEKSEIESCNRSEGSYWVSDEKFIEMATNYTYIDD